MFRFGVFELDAQSGELRRHGLKIRLPDQSFQILQHAPAASRRIGHARRASPGAVDRGDVRRLRGGFEQRGAEAARGAGRLGRQSAVRRDGAAARLPLRRAGDRATRRSGAASGHGVRQARRAGFSAAVRAWQRPLSPSRYPHPSRSVALQRPTRWRAGGPAVRSGCRDRRSCLYPRAALYPAHADVRRTDPVPRRAAVREPDRGPGAGLLRRQRDGCGHRASRPGSRASM